VGCIAKHRSCATSVKPRKCPENVPPNQRRRGLCANNIHNSNSLFLIPVFHFPWSEKGREHRMDRVHSKTDRDTV